MNIRLIIGLLCVAFISYVSWCSYDYGYKKARTEQIDSYESMIQQLKADVGKALQRERIAYAKQEQIESNYLAKHKEIEHNANSTIDEYRTNNVRLRESLKAKQCPDVSSVANSTSGNHATTTGGLHDRDVEFLIRYAARADAVAEQLKSAQALIKQDRVLCNGQTEPSNINEKIVSQGTSRGAPQAGAKTSHISISV